MEPHTSRPSVPELDTILGTSFRVLDDGFIRVVDYMGSDESVVQSARVSYGSGTKSVTDDRGLIRYLMRHRHTTPFEMCEIKLHIRVPMDTWRQWIRHRTANVNEYSTRYSVAIDAIATTDPHSWRKQDPGNKQGSTTILDVSVGERLSQDEAALHRLSREVYQRRLDAGVAREQARKDLPLATYTEAYWKIDLHNLLHFLELRLAETAQLEIRQYALLLADQIVSRWCPLTWAAFVDYRLTSLILSAVELRIVKLMQAGKLDVAQTLCAEMGLVRSSSSGLVVLREGKEFAVKLERLGQVPPWESITGVAT